MYSRRDFSKLGIALAGGLATFKGLSRTITPGMAEGTRQKFEVTKTDEEWRKTLTPEQFEVLRKHGTERAGSSPLDANSAPGTYECAGGALPLYSSETKFHSGTGWPSFWKPLDNAVGTSSDNTYLMTPPEVHRPPCCGQLAQLFQGGREAQ